MNTDWLYRDLHKDDFCPPMCLGYAAVIMLIVIVVDTFIL